jgi:FlaA1/EpsC-like NDP-sugar epimerase
MNVKRFVKAKINPGRRLAMWFVQIAVIALSAVCAFLLRFDFSLPATDFRNLEYALLTWLFIKVVIFRLAKLDRGLWEYVSLVDVVRVSLANLVASALSVVVILRLEPAGFPRSIYCLDLMLCFLGTAGVRLAVRFGVQVRANFHNGSPQKRSLIYGAGSAGTILLREVRTNPKLAYRIFGFIDDMEAKDGMLVAGVPVLGGGEKLASIVGDRKIEVILIALPSASGAQMTRILRLCHAAGVECKTVPGVTDILEGTALAGQIREVAVEDLLGRTPVHLDVSKIRRVLAGNVMLVTGAAGSIGSELCRQIARFSPAGIVGFEIAESPLFEIDREMRQKFPEIPFYAEIGSIQNIQRVDEVMRRYRPSVVYHAAAYKHVPLMEEHVFEAIENNVFGTYHVAKSAARHGVRDFVLISSDKAVRPTNVMGATKRIAELMLNWLQKGGTQFIAVRFGNVLGSNGSVIPTFKQQIASGGPVTVTHPEMRRFFMTIPEACQLVLQASAIAKGGQICVLDMGCPVKIVDLATNLILLSGLKPDEDIKIEFTGIRPGEKLYEELSSSFAETIPTQHEKVQIFVENGLPETDMQSWLDSLHKICAARNISRLVVALKEVVQDYNPSTELLKRMVDHNAHEHLIAEVHPIPPALYAQHLPTRSGHSVAH